jgi:hypothetical protein
MTLPDPAARRLKPVPHRLALWWAATLLSGSAFGADDAVTRLDRAAAACQLPAVSQAVRSVPLHEQALRTASGRCARFVLAVVPAADLPRVCASQPAWGAAQTARELRRRIADIDADRLLRGTVQGQACRAAYLYELKNTRVTLRVATPSAAVR